MLTNNEIIERKNLAELIRFTRCLIELLLADTDLTPSAGSPMVLIIEAYVRIAIPIARIPIFSGPNTLARYVIETIKYDSNMISEEVRVNRMVVQ